MENIIKNHSCSQKQNKEVELVLERLASSHWPEDIYAAREYYDQWGTSISNDVSVKKLSFSQFKGYWLTPKKCLKRVILFFHGGGFVFGSFKSHGGLAAEIGRVTASHVLHIDYRRAPDFLHPAPIEDALTAYQWLIAQGYKGHEIILAGDSAGGGLVISTLLALTLKKQQISLPALGVCICPWVDFTLSGASYNYNQNLDPTCQREVAQQVRNLYLGEVSYAEARALSPVYEDLSGLPPLLVQVSNREIFYSDANALVTAAEKCGVRVKFDVWENMYHVWHLHYLELESAQLALAEIKGFIDSVLQESTLSPIT